MSPIEIYLAIGAVFGSYVMLTERGYEVRAAAGEFLTFALVTVAYPLAIIGRIVLNLKKRKKKNANQDQ